MSFNKVNRRNRIKKRIRKIVIGTDKKPRLSVFRSNKEIYSQLIDQNQYSPNKTPFYSIGKSSEQSRTPQKSESPRAKKSRKAIPSQTPSRIPITTVKSPPR